MIFVAHYNSTKILQPGKQAFDFPPPFVTPQFSAVLRLRLFSIGFVRRNQFYVESRQCRVQRVGVIRLIANYSAWTLVGKASRKGLLNESNFVRRSTRCVNGDRKTSAVCHCHELRTLAPLGFTDIEAPFLAEANVPSTKHSDKSSLPRVNKSSASVSNTRLSLPLRFHSWNRRWHVWYGGKRSGKSDQRAPERKIQRTPFITSRSSRRGLPRVSTVGGVSNNDSMMLHCSSVNSSRRAITRILSNYF